jgi:hypothetical protein
MRPDGLASGRPVLLCRIVRAAIGIRVGRDRRATAGWTSSVSRATGGAKRELATARQAPFRRDQSPHGALGVDMVDVARDGAVGELEITH